MIEDLVAYAGPTIRQHGYWMVGAIIWLEAMGLPLPGESLMIAAALYAATTHELSIELLVLAAAIGAVMGDNCGYLIGARLGRPAMERWGPRIGLSVQRQRLGQYLFLRYGGVVVFFGRFIAFLRTFAALLAGANRMVWPRFLFWNALGGLCWTGGYGFGAYFLGTEMARITGPIGLGLAGAGLAAIAWAIWFLKTNEHRMILRAEAAMAARETAMAQH